MKNSKRSRRARSAPGRKMTHFTRMARSAPERIQLPLRVPVRNFKDFMRMLK